MNLKNHGNQYAALLRDFDRIPKTVLAAVAVSVLTQGGEFDRIDPNSALLSEWWILHRNGIVPQRPPGAEPADDSLTDLIAITR